MLSAFVAAMAFPLTQQGSDANMAIATNVLIFSATAMGLNIVVGLAGLPDLRARRAPWRRPASTAPDVLALSRRSCPIHHPSAHDALRAEHQHQDEQGERHDVLPRSGVEVDSDRLDLSLIHI